VENIRFALILFSAFCCIGLFGCSSSEESYDDQYVTDYQETESEQDIDTAETSAPETSQQPVSVSSNRRFNVQADTLTVQSKKKEKLNTPPLTVKNSAPQTYYSVQIGAYRLKSNTDRNYMLSLKRFQLPVIRFYEKGIKMERVCVGHFSSLKMAQAFLKKIQKQYPADYAEAWVAELKQ
jgi:cell division protein FtsN